MPNYVTHNFDYQNLRIISAVMLNQKSDKSTHKLLINLAWKQSPGNNNEHSFLFLLKIKNKKINFLTATEILISKKTFFEMAKNCIILI
jgi:hypothetical protein